MLKLFQVLAGYICKNVKDQDTTFKMVVIRDVDDNITNSDSDEPLDMGA